MEFHPDKCQLLRITNKLKPISADYFIHNIPLSLFDSVKYLGIHIDSNLNWNVQTNHVFNKASFMLSFLERNLARCPGKVKENCFNALVRPLLEYSCSAWDPYKQNQIDKLELINKRAALFITGNYTREHGNSNKNFEALGWCSLRERRLRSKVSLLFKIQTDLIHIPGDDLIPNPRKPDKFLIPSSSVDAHLHSFFPSTVRLWNSLPPSCKSKPSLDSFKASLEGITILPPRKF